MSISFELVSSQIGKPYLPKKNVNLNNIVASLLKLLIIKSWLNSDYYWIYKI